MSEWRDISEAPKDGTPVLGGELYRYQLYKIRSMKAGGRWQRWNGYGWENSAAPEVWQPAQRKEPSDVGSREG